MYLLLNGGGLIHTVNYQFPSAVESYPALGHTSDMF